MSLFSELKIVLRHSATYSIANILNGMVSFVMIPIYTRFLSPADYGILELITITLSILSIVLASGITDAVSRFYFDYKETKDRNKVVSVGLISFMALGLASFVILAPFSSFMSETILESSEYSSFFLIAVGYMSVGFVLQVIFAYFRVTRRSISLTLSNLAGLVVSLSLNILFVVVLEIGVRGILLATLISQSLQVLVLLPMVLKRVGFHFERRLFKNMFKFGFPIIFSQISHQMVTASDRFFIKAFASLADTGLYSLGYKLGALVVTFVGTPFDMIWTPRRIENFGQEQAEKDFARIFTIFIAVISLVGLFVSILVEDLLKLLVAEPFWDAYKVVPIIALTYVFHSFNYHFHIGLLIKKKTMLYAGINMATAALNLILNYFLIKAYSIWGAAIATLICYIFKPTLIYYYSNRIYPILMEKNKLVAILGSATLVYLGCSMIETGSVYLNLGLKSAVGLGQIALLYFLRIFGAEEIGQLKSRLAGVLQKVGGVLRLTGKR